MAQATVQKILRGHTEEVSSVAFSPDNKLIASASGDKTVRLWNIPSGELNAELKGHTHWVSSVAFSPDGKSIVTGSCDNIVRTWSVATKQQVQILKGHSGFVRSVAWSPNGDLIASSSLDKTVILWDAISGSIKKKLTDHAHVVFSVSFSQNGNKLASAGWDKTVIIWDVDSGAALIKLGHSDFVNSVCFSPDDQFVVTGCRDKIVHMFNVNDGREEKRFEGHTRDVYSVACSFDGAIIVSGAKNHSVRLWDMASTKPLQKMGPHTKAVRSVVFSRDGKFIASGSSDKTIRLWNVPSSFQTTVQSTTQIASSSRQTFKKASRNIADSSADEIEPGDMSGEATRTAKSLKSKPSKRKVLTDDMAGREDEQEEEEREGEEHPRKIAKLAPKTIGDLNERSEQRKSSSTAKTTPVKPTSAPSTTTTTKPSPKLAVDSQKSSSSKTKTDSNFSEPVVTKTTAEHDAKKSSPAPKVLQEKSTEATTFAPPSPIPSPKAVRVVSSISESAQKFLDTHGILIQPESDLNDVVQFDTIPTAWIQVKPGTEYRVTVQLNHPNFLSRIHQIITDFELSQSLAVYLEVRERLTDMKALDTIKIFQDNPNGSTLHAIPRFSCIIKMPSASENKYWLILRLGEVHALLGTLFRIQLRIT